MLNRYSYDPHPDLPEDYFDDEDGLEDFGYGQYQQAKVDALLPPDGAYEERLIQLKELHV